MFVFGLIVVFEKCEYFPHIVMFGGTNSKALDPVVIIILYNFISFGCIAEIVFIKDDDFLFLVAFDDEIELSISTAVRNTSVSYLEKNIYFMSVLFD